MDETINLLKALRVSSEILTEVRLTISDEGYIAVEKTASSTEWNKKESFQFTSMDGLKSNLRKLIASAALGENEEE